MPEATHSCTYLRAIASEDGACEGTCTKQWSADGCAKSWSTVSHWSSVRHWRGSSCHWCGISGLSDGSCDWCSLHNRCRLHNLRLHHPFHSLDLRDLNNPVLVLHLRHWNLPH